MKVVDLGTNTLCKEGLACNCRVVNGISEKLAFELAINRKLEHLTSLLPEGCRNEMEVFDASVQWTRSMLGFAINSFFDKLIERVGTSNINEFVKAVEKDISKEFRLFMYLLLDRKSIEPSLNDYLINNYLEYLPNRS